ncbi:hypothetical protein GCM10025873_23760 [Demequina sediminis]|nr:hypothetical protein GCM10025873_23760 [Demequina sediminis]
MSISVVLPQPFGPINAVTLPGCTSSVALVTACTEPNARATPLALTAAVDTADDITVMEPPRFARRGRSPAADTPP